MFKPPFFTSGLFIYYYYLLFIYLVLVWIQCLLRCVFFFGTRLRR